MSGRQSPIVASIWAQDRNGVIGDGTGMLWQVPDDFRHFKRSTLGSPVIMGRTSFEALGRPLPGRLNIVLTRDPNYAPQGVLVASSLDQGIRLAREHTLDSADPQRPGGPHIWITGGGQVYQQSMDIVDELVVTYLDIEAAKPPPGRHTVTAPTVDPNIWTVDPSRSDDDWRPASGDARWKVITYVRGENATKL